MSRPNEIQMILSSYYNYGMQIVSILGNVVQIIVDGRE